MRKPKLTPAVNADRWYASYSVLMTLMFALFVVLFSTAQVDRDRFKELAESLQQAFGMNAPRAGAGMKRVAEAQKAEIQKAINTRQEFGQMRDQVEELFAVESRGTVPADWVRLENEGVSLNVRIQAPQLFRVGRAELATDVLPLLDRVGRVLATSPRRIRIEGHAAVGEAKDAWALAVARARAVSEYFTGRVGIAGGRITLAASAPDTEATRRGQQAVELVVSP